MLLYIQFITAKIIVVPIILAGGTAAKRARVLRWKQ